MLILDIPLTDWLMAIISIFLFLLGCFVWRINAKIGWFTGALETHSELMLRIEAKRGINGEPIKVIWWNPLTKHFPFSGEHSTEAELSEIYLGIPPKFRGENQNWYSKVKLWLSGAPIQ